MECYLVQNGGGTSLNFKVICNPQPETAKENTIWVDTDRINNYYFSATQPENMVEYDVWFTLGSVSPVAFSATKKNPIMVYPLSAKQYIGGALLDKTAKSYQRGKWTALFDLSNYFIHPNIEVDASKWDVVKGAGNNTVTFNEDNSITMSVSAGESQLRLYSKELLSGYAGKKIIIEYEYSSDTFTNFAFGLTSSKPATGGWVSYTDVNEKQSNGNFRIVYNVPATATNGYLAVSLGGAAGYPARTIRIVKLWSE